MGQFKYHATRFQSNEAYRLRNLSRPSHALDDRANQSAVDGPYPKEFRVPLPTDDHRQSSGMVDPDTMLLHGFVEWRPNPDDTVCSFLDGPPDSRIGCILAME